MTLIDNWKTVLLKAWSVKFTVIASIFAGAETAVAIWQPSGIPNGVFAGLAALVAALAPVARIYAQKEVSGATDPTTTPK